MKPIPKNEIVRLRQRMALTQEEFAALIGVSRVAVTHWESGRRTPSGPARILISRIREK